MKKGLIGMFLSAALTVGFALAASDVELFDREILSNSRNFTVHEGKFTPAGPDRAAVMEFPTGKWSALYRKQALPALPAGEDNSCCISCIYHARKTGTAIEASKAAERLSLRLRAA